MKKFHYHNINRFFHKLPLTPLSSLSTLYKSNKQLLDYRYYSSSSYLNINKTLINSNNNNTDNTNISNSHISNTNDDNLDLSEELPSNESSLLLLKTRHTTAHIMAMAVRSIYQSHLNLISPSNTTV
jgi:hypothetical protein